uniref:Protein m41.1 n=1 Tax=Mastomys natalensis cytomegalovirus 1 TaxID=2973541 RepID=A0A9Y1IQE0_9BETA|nr:protein m41.1 [Mastomys natalensis cytomegalovirus 1]WEG68907.1 protein m41.1 [Mastomys natalensis cytomegalovirus 1]WEG71135.1 protein m41.1 [Mastomys natalensis cytomegalovirus 1]
MIVAAMVAAYLALAPSGRIPLTDRSRMSLRENLVAGTIVTALLYFITRHEIRTHR